MRPPRCNRTADAEQLVQSVSKSSDQGGRLFCAAMSDEEPVDKKIEIENSCKPECIKQLLKV